MQNTNCLSLQCILLSFFFFNLGYKFIFRGSLDGKKCDKDYYQPFKFWTNATSKCLLQKSQCTEEGQITAEDGNSITDRTCRCDYTRGYTFFKQPLKKCFCVPSLEDCSCHQTTCPSSYHFTPGMFTARILISYSIDNKLNFIN